MSLTVGDSRPALSGFATSGGVGVDLTGCTLRLHLSPPSGSVLDVAAIAVGIEGCWAYIWQPNDIDEAGTWAVELQVTFADGGVQTFGPATFTVREQIA